ncbi:MAG TPA: hypothetical protein VLL28_00515 [Hyphomicrobiaceae bacterium]|nr:hypothetical protein [Hyphomicrobiaceae bacterium]
MRARTARRYGLIATLIAIAVILIIWGIPTLIRLALSAHGNTWPIQVSLSSPRTLTR